jgi:HK97 family phage major capsid protein
MTLEDYQREIEARKERMKEIRRVHTNENRRPNDDEKRELRKLMEEIKALKDEADLLLEEEALNTALAKTDKRTGRPAVGVTADGQSTAVVTDGGGLGFQFREGEHFRTMGEQLRAVLAAGSPGGEMDRRLTRAATGMGEAVPSDGGFLFQPDFSATLMQKTIETGQVLSRCSRIPVGPGKNGLVMNAINETSRADGSRWGGIRAYWADEAEEKTGSKPKLRQMTLTLKKLIGLCYATDELLEDATALEAVIMNGFSKEFGFKGDDAVVNGTGAGQPLGIMNSPALVTVPIETGQAAATVVVENIVNMWSRCMAGNRQNAVWFINQDVEPQLFTMGITVGLGGSPIYMPPGGLSASPYATLMGRPVIAIEQCQTLGTAGDIILADLSEYVLIDKGNMQSAQSIHVRFIYDETAFRFVLRIDGQPGWNSALTPFKGSNTKSPFVTLATRA